MSNSLFGGTGGATLAADATQYTLGVQVTVSQACALNAIRFNSPAGAAALPVACGLFRMTGPGAGSLVASDLSPLWGGSLAGAGWVQDALTGYTLQPGNVYKAAVLGPSGADWYGVTSNYWSSGAGSGGISSGPLSAPNNAGGDGGQDTFVTPSATLLYPATSNLASNYWVDLLVTPAGGPVTAAAPNSAAVLAAALAL